MDIRYVAHINTAVIRDAVNASASNVDVQIVIRGGILIQAHGLDVPSEGIELSATSRTMSNGHYALTKHEMDGESDVVL